MKPVQWTTRWSTFTFCAAALLPFSVAAAEYHEAPALEAAAMAETLPPVADRLPLHPMVVTPEESIGQYGGTWRATMFGASDHWWLIKTVSYEPLIRFDAKSGKLIPNLAESFEANDDATEFTFTLREGLKWSDGEPYTADDIMFWFEDVFSDPELTPAPAKWLSTESGPAVVEKVDERTVRFTFQEPNGLFLRKLASNSNIGEIAPIHMYPRHYLEKLLPKYNENAEAEAKAAGASSWAEHFGNVTGSLSRWRYAGMPTLLPWVLTSPYDDRGLVAAERNPYYFKVDPQNNQLPYLDGYEFRVVQDAEAMVLRALAGEIDLQDRTIATLKNKAVLYDNQDRGNYHLFDVPTPDHNQMIVYLNLNHNDLAKRELYQNKNFRIALSHATDRQEIIDLVYFGQGEPWQAAPRRESVHFDEEFAKQYTEYDPDKANALLDEIGLTERDSSGFRLDKDGNRVAVFLEVPSDFRPDWTDVVELMKAQWQKVGVDLQIRPLGRALIRNRALANEHDAFVFIGNGGLDTDLYLEANNFFPHDDTGYRTFALLWSNYFAGLEPSEEPPASVKAQFEARRKLLGAADPAVQQAAMQTIIDGAKEAFYTIGTALPSPGYGIVSNDMHNVPGAIVNYGPIPYIGVVNPEQFYKTSN